MEALTPLLVFKALSEPTRFYSILLLLSEKSLCVCELESALNEEQPKVSRHLALLRKQHILTTERQGKWVYYQINPELPKWVYDIFSLAFQNNTSLTELKTNLIKMPDRPNACC